MPLALTIGNMPKAKKKAVPIITFHAQATKPSVPSNKSSAVSQKKTTGAKRPRETSTHQPHLDRGVQQQKQNKKQKHSHNDSTTSKHQYQLVCHNIIDRQAAKALQTLLEADAGSGRGGTLKSLTLAPHIVEKKATYAVTCQVLKHWALLQQVVSKSGLLQQPRVSQMSPYSACVLVYELLIGQGLSQVGVAERLIFKHKANLQAAMQEVLSESNLQTVSEYVAANSPPEPPTHPRWVRVNTLKMTVRDALKQLQSQYGSATLDPLLPDLIALPANTALHNHPLVVSGALVLQGKSSCMPAHALSPAPGWLCVDCCAAPGNKTTYVAALLQGKGSVIAFDKDARRLQRLKENAHMTGSLNIIQAKLQDFLSVDTLSPEYAQVQGVILDPSCSGSGTLVSRQDHLLPSWAATYQSLQEERRIYAALLRGELTPAEVTQQIAMLREKDILRQQGIRLQDDTEAHTGQQGDDNRPAEDHRVKQLAKFQVAALHHALTFPALQRLVYSTCSIHIEENELVVQEVLPTARRLGFDLKLVFPTWPRRGLPLFPECDKLVRTDPFEDDTDGFFVAVFEKTKAASPHVGSQQQQAEGDNQIDDEGAMQHSKVAVAATNGHKHGGKKKKRT